MSKYCGNCGHKINENAYICVKCGVVVNNNNANSNNIVVDSGGVGWSFLGFFFPIVGLILYFSWKNSKPKTALSVGKGALVSVIIGVIVYVFLMILLGIIFAVLVSGF